jgi:hypothetical protein
MIDVAIKGQGIGDGNLGITVDTATVGTNGFQTTTGTYIGGDPVGVGTSGLVFGSQLTDIDYVGVFYNNSIIDSDVGRGYVLGTTDLTIAQPAIVPARSGVKARLFQGARQNATDSRLPFNTTAPDGGTEEVTETVASHAASGYDVLANAASGTGLLVSVSSVTRENANGQTETYTEGTQFQITSDMLDWSIRGTLDSPTYTEVSATVATGTGLASGTYYYAITTQSNTVTGESNWLTGTLITGDVNAVSGTVALAWPAVDNALGYFIYRTTNTSGFGTSSAGRIANVTGTTFSDDASYAVTGATDPAVTNTAYDEPIPLSGYSVTYTYGNTWTVGDRLYIQDSTGIWTNVINSDSSASVGRTAFGMVVEVPSTVEIVVEFF